MATERLDFADSHLLEFDARVVGTIERDGRTAVALDRTAFYPTGGGQPHDTGVIESAGGRWLVDEVAVGEGEDRVLHFVRREGAGAPAPEVGAAVHGRVDAARRRDHLQQHTGQHILSQAFVQAAGAATRSFHLGAATSTIDVDPKVTDEAAARAVALANDVVFSDRPTRLHEVGPDELARFAIRRQTFHGERIRLVEIEGFDVSTCGGTHAQRTGEVGLILVKSVEKAKGLHRVEFVCGGRALREYAADHAIVQGAARALSTGAEAVVGQVHKLLEQGAAQRRRIRERFAAAADALAAALLAQAAAVGAARVVTATLADLDFEEAQLLAKKLVESGPVVALLGVADPAAPRLLFARSDDPALAALAMGPLARQVAERFGGRGGGGPASAQASVADARSLAAALEFARASLPPRA